LVVGALKSKFQLEVEVLATMMVSLTRDEMEARRFLAAQEFLAGRSQAQVAGKFGVSRATVSRWHRTLFQKGMEALRKRKATGRPSCLTPSQIAELVQVYRAPKAYGINVEQWSVAQFAKTVNERFGVNYHVDHVRRILHHLGLLKPERECVRRAAAVA
jgi:transposase